MNKIQLEKIEGVLKVLEKATFNNQNVNDQYDTVKRLSDFSNAFRELKEELANPLKPIEQKLELKVPTRTGKK